MPLPSRPDPGRAGRALSAPHLLDLEVAQVLRRYEHSGALPVWRGRGALEAALLTRDRRLAGVPGHGALVEVV